MTREDLEHIQSVCREWLRQPGTGKDSRLTIPSGEALSRPVELKIEAFLTFDNVRITSAVDAETGAHYTRRIGEFGQPEIFIDTPFEEIPAPPSEPPARAALRVTQKRYQEAMDRIAESERVNEYVPPSSHPDVWWLEKESLDSEDLRPKYLLYTSKVLLGYSLLERARSGGERSGRFHPSEDYFEYAEIFDSLPEAETDCFEAVAEEAYGIVNDRSEEYRTRFKELSAQVDALQLYVENEAGHPIEATEIRLEDLSRRYGDQTERWLYITVDDKKAFGESD